MRTDETLQDGGQPQPSNKGLGPRAASSYRAGDLVGSDYRLLAIIGQGGMGTVFRAEHILMGREFALKLLSPEMVNEATWQRFATEAKILSKLNHPNIVQIFNMGIDRERAPYYVMELLKGSSLAEIIKRYGRLPLSLVADIFMPVTQGLSFSHKNGVIHRDLKPSNIMLVGEYPHFSGVKLVDFGIAKTSQVGNFEGQSLTTTGEIFGTPYYISPERIAGAAADERSDVYSLGCAIFEALTGYPPYCGETTMHTLMMHQNANIPTLASVNPNGRYSPELEAFIAKILAKEPSARFKNMSEVEANLSRLKNFGGAEDLAFENAAGDMDEPVFDLQLDTSSTQILRPPLISRGIRNILAVTCSFALAGIVYFVVLPSLKVRGPAPKINSTLLLSDSITRDGLKTCAGIKKYSMGLVQTPQGEMLHFRFSPKVAIGEIYWSSPHYGKVEARGEVFVPASSSLTLHLFTEVLPDLLPLRKFNNDEFSHLYLSTSEIDELTKITSNWTKLDTLRLTESEISTDGEVACFDRLTRLKDLTVSHCNIPGEAFSRLKLLRGLNCLRFETVADTGKPGATMGGALSTLKDCRHLTSLLVQKCLISHEVIRDIASCTSLEQLDLTSSSPSGITDEDILQLSSLPNLRRLGIDTARLTPRSIDYFARFRSLKSLRLSKPNWSKADLARLKRLFKGGGLDLCEYFTGDRRGEQIREIFDDVRKP